jgi:hypothetical protein
VEDTTVSIPVGVAAPSLTVAGLASWVLAGAGEQEAAERCGIFQDVVDEAFRRGERTAVVVARSLAEEAAQLWESAAALLDGEASVHPQRPRPQEDQQAAARLRLRAERIRRLLREPTSDRLRLRSEPPRTAGDDPDRQ